MSDELEVHEGEIVPEPVLESVEEAPVAPEAVPEAPEAV